jgi:hypothetical protein
MRNLEDVKRDLQNNLISYQLEFELWSKVEIVKKKDGTDFQSRSKSFKNADWKIPNYSDDLHPVLSVTGRDARGNYKTFTLYMYIYTDELSDADERKAKGKSYSTISRPTYVYTPDEAYIVIKDRIMFLEKMISETKAQIEVAPYIYDKFFGMIKSACLELKNMCIECGVRDESSKYPTSLEYDIFDALKNMSYLEMR